MSVVRRSSTLADLAKGMLAKHVDVMLGGGLSDDDMDLAAEEFEQRCRREEGARFDPWGCWTEIEIDVRSLRERHDYKRIRSMFYRPWYAHRDYVKERGMNGLGFKRTFVIGTWVTDNPRSVKWECVYRAGTTITVYDSRDVFMLKEGDLFVKDPGGPLWFQVDLQKTLLGRSSV